MLNKKEERRIELLLTMLREELVEEDYEEMVVEENLRWALLLLKEINNELKDLKKKHEELDDMLADCYLERNKLRGTA